LDLPIPLLGDDDFPILHYADGALIFMQRDVTQLNHLKDLLSEFAESTGLKVNFDKSMMIPINVTDDRLDISATTFGCSKGTTFYLPRPNLKSDQAFLLIFGL